MKNIPFNKNDLELISKALEAYREALDIKYREETTVGGSDKINELIFQVEKEEERIKAILEAWA